MKILKRDLEHTSCSTPSSSKRGEITKNWESQNFDPREIKFWISRQMHNQEVWHFHQGTHPLNQSQKKFCGEKHFFFERMFQNSEWVYTNASKCFKFLSESTNILQENKNSYFDHFSQYHWYYSKHSLYSWWKLIIETVDHQCWSQCI